MKREMRGIIGIHKNSPSLLPVLRNYEEKEYYVGPTDFFISLPYFSSLPNRRSSLSLFYFSLPSLSSLFLPYQTRR